MGKCQARHCIGTLLSSSRGVDGEEPSIHFPRWAGWWVCNSLHTLTCTEGGGNVSVSTAFQLRDCILP